MKLYELWVGLNVLHSVSTCTDMHLYSFKVHVAFKSSISVYAAKMCVHFCQRVFTSTEFNAYLSSLFVNSWVMLSSTLSSLYKAASPSTLPGALIGWKMERSPKGRKRKVHLWAAFKDNSVIHFGIVWNKPVFSVGFGKCRLLDELWMLLLSCQANCEVAD